MFKFDEEMKENDLKFIYRCFELAEKGRGLTRGNPLVGAVFAHEDKIVSEGYHRTYGEAHAEVNCLEKVIDPTVLSQGMLYVSLEPCSHSGKTPPCADYILKKGIKKVIIGSLDPNIAVNGKGMDFLLKNGVEVINCNLLEMQELLNISFIINKTKNRPYFTGKYASSNDGFISKKGEQYKITTKEIDFWSHKLRSESDAILIGSNTWRIDQPELTTRLYYGTSPDIIILSHSADLSVASRSNQKITILNSEINKSVENVCYINVDMKNMDSIADRIYELGYANVLIEGGSQVLDSFHKARLLDQFIVIKNTSLILTSGIQAPHIDFNFYKLKYNKSYGNQTISTYILNQ